MRIAEGKGERKEGMRIKEYKEVEEERMKGGRKKEEKALEWKKITSSLPRHAGQTLAKVRCNLSPGSFSFFSGRQQLETQISHPVTADDERRDGTEDQRNGRPIRVALIE